jgi:hypothetical protein
LSRGCPVYLALHSIDGIEVLNSAEYREKGGGNFARWQQHICDWHRNLYDGLNTAPAVGDDGYLLMTALGPDRLIELGAVPSAMRAVDLEKYPEERWLATLSRDRLPAPSNLPDGVDLYTPMTAQLTSS